MTISEVLRAMRQKLPGDRAARRNLARKMYRVARKAARKSRGQTA
jgi:hypothetical protein